MTTQASEVILAVPRTAIDGAFAAGQFIHATAADMAALFTSRFYGERARLEHDRGYKQIISYILIRRGDSLLCYERRGKERRLAGLLSIGVGGHVDYPERIQSAAYRELREEVKWAAPVAKHLRLVGLLNEDESDAGNHHIGVVYTMTVADNADIESYETALRNVRFETMEALYRLRTSMELWSRICMDHLTAIF